ncbi:T9SS C-terminal target domain-containing protein [Hymenobacter rubripertinctus]|nr:T9SS C-terminal target domain-containing protein [Hymenobacter rubripertinctus]
MPQQAGPVARTSALAWSSAASLLAPRAQHAVEVLNGKIYLWAGYDGSVAMSGSQVYDIATNVWSVGTPYPFAVRGHAHAVGNNGLLYSFSGSNGAVVPNNCYSFNPATSVWTAIAPIPTPVWESRAVTGTDGRIYVFGGEGSPTITQIYNPTTDTWTTGASMPGDALGSVAVRDANNLLHVIAGFNRNYSAVNTHYVYNPTTNTWTTAAALPAARAQAAGVLGANNKIYVMGGKSDGGNLSGSFNTTYVYDLATNTWSTDTNLPTTLGETKAVSSGTALFVVAGTGNGSAQSVVYQSGVTAEVTATSWTGAISTDWSDADNWSNDVPTTTTAVTIPAGRPRYPVLTTGTYTAGALTLASGGALTQSGGTLSLTGNFSNAGTFTATGGTLALTGSASQTLGGSSTTSLWNLSVGASGTSLSGPASVQRLLTLNGNLTTSSQPFMLLSGPALTAMVVNSGGIVVGTAAMQRYIDPSLNAGLGYRHYSSPVQGTTVADLATSGFTPVVNPDYNTAPNPGATRPFPTVYGYDEARLTSASALTQAFEFGYFSPAALSNALNPGRGYTVNIAASEKVALMGTLNNGTVPVGALSRGSQANAGWQLLGNPYPAPLDWNAARTGLPTGVQDAIYVYKSADQYNGSYQSYVNGVGTLPGGLIPAMQGFFLRVSQNVPSFSFQNAWRATSYQNPTFNRATADARPLVQLDLVDARGTHEPTFVYFEAGATADFDSHFDAGKLANSTGLNLSSEAAGQQLAVNGLPVLTAGPVSVALAVGVPTTGTYVLEAAVLANLASTAVYLHDAETGQRVNLHQQPRYSFTASNAALISGRFSLSFGPLGPLATTAGALAARVQAYPNPAHSQLTIVRPAGGTASATLLNAVGQVVRTVALPTAQTTLDVADLPAGLYLVRVVVNGEAVTKRLVVE